MLAVIAGALAARRGQALAVLLLSLLASAAAAVAPMYASAAGQALATYELSAATPEEHRLRFSSREEYEGIPGDPALAGFGREAAPFGPDGFEVVLGAQGGGTAAGPAGTVTTNLTYRDGVCERVSLTGVCPTPTPEGQRREAMLSTGTAAHLGVGVGGEFTFNGLPLRVTGVYRPLDATDPYWLGDEYLRPPAPRQGSAAAAGSAEDAIFIAASSYLTDEHAVLHRWTADFYLPEHLLRTRTADDLKATVTAAARDATYEGFGAGTAMGNLLDRVTRQQSQLADGVTLGAGLLVLLCWLVLFVAVGSAADERRPEQGLLLLRGVQRRRLWTLAVGEHAVPVAAAIPLGCLVGLAAAGLLTAHTLPADVDVALGPAAFGYAAAAAVGALAAVLLAQMRALSAPVVDLLRRVPARARGWRASAGDIAAVSVAVAALVQLRAGGPPTGLALLAPVVGALAVGVLLARVAMLAGAALGAVLLARGRTAVGLALLQVTRQPRFRPLIALLAVVVAMLAFTAAARGVATTAYEDRATVEVGAPRVVGVEALSRQHLLEATRAVDPQGRFAMAVVARSASAQTGTPVLAVDSDRLAAVAAPHPSYGPALADVARLIRPVQPAAPVLLRAPLLTVVASATYDEDAFAGFQPRLFVTVATTAGTRRIGAGEPIKPGRREYRVVAPECAAGCRLVTLDVGAPVVPGPLTVRFTELRAGLDGPAVLSGADLARETRWRHQGAKDFSLYATGGSEPALVVEVSDGRYANPFGIAVADTPSPMPVVLTRSERTAQGWMHAYEGVDGTPTTAWVAGQADRLPRLGGAGLVIDLEYADRSAVAGQTGVEEVWLGPAAPGDVLDRLRGQGLVVRYDRTIRAEREDFDRQAPALALTFNLFAALAGVVIGAAGLVAMAAAERRNRVRTLVALRRQGLPARAVRGGFGWLVAVAAVAGGLVTVVVWFLARDGQRLFRDGRSPVPSPGFPDPGWLALIMVPAVVALAVTAVVLGRVLAASIRRRAGS